MAYNDFIKFATNHRNLLETAIKKYPTVLKPSDLVEFDQIMLETKKELRNQGLLETWKPLASFKSPEDFIYVRENDLILEVISDKIKSDNKINPATRSQINAIESLRAWFDGLPRDAQVKVDQFTSNFSPNKNKFTQELEDIEEKINSMYGQGDKGGVFSKAAKNVGGWLTRGMSKLTGAGRVEDTTLEEKISINENLEETFSNANILENVMIAELFAVEQLNEQAPGISFPGFPNFQAAFDAGKVIAPHARRAHRAVTTIGGGGGGTSPAATMTAIKGAGGKGAAATMTAMKGGAGAKGLGGVAATAGKLAVLKTGLMVGGGVLAAAAVYGGWTARDTRKRVESLLKVARSLKAIGFAPPVEPEAEKASASAGGASAGGASAGGASAGGASVGGASVGGASAGEAKRGTPVEKTANKKDIHIYSGSQGKGFQSRVAQKINLDPALKAKAGESQKAAAKVMRGLAADLKQANFNVLEEKSSKAPGRKEIGFSQTLAALDTVKDNTLRELLRIELLKTLRDEGLKVTSDSLKPGSSDRVTAVVDNVNAVSDEKNNSPSAKAPAKKNGGNAEKKASETPLTKAVKPNNNPPDLSSPSLPTPTENTEDLIAGLQNMGKNKTDLILGARKILTDYDPAKDNAKKDLYKAINNFDEKNDLDSATGIEDFGTKAKEAGLYESLKRKYRLGLITLREYNIKKQKLDNLILKEEIKCQVASLLKR